MAIISTTIADVNTLIDDYRRDTASGQIDSAKKLRAQQEILKMIHAKRLYSFMTRRKAFDYLLDEVEYQMPDTLGIADFREIKDVRFVDDHTQRITQVDPDELRLDIGKGIVRDRCAISWRDGTPVLLLSVSGNQPHVILHDASDH